MIGSSGRNQGNSLETWIQWSVLTCLGLEKVSWRSLLYIKRMRIQYVFIATWGVSSTSHLWLARCHSCKQQQSCMTRICKFSQHVTLRATSKSRILRPNISYIFHRCLWVHQSSVMKILQQHQQGFCKYSSMMLSQMPNGLIGVFPQQHQQAWWDCLMDFGWCRGSLTNNSAN